MNSSSSGHRARILDRFTTAGITALHDHEILELLLSFAIPRRDTKGMAKELLGRYKTVGKVLNAPAEELQEFDGIGIRAAALFSLTGEVASICLREKYERGSAVTNREHVHNYLRFHFGFKRHEYIAVLYLNSANRVITTQIVAEGTVNQCAVYPRTIIAKALSCGAASLIMAHNHPGGCPNASDPDWDLTRRIWVACKALDLPLLDHIVILPGDVISLRATPKWRAMTIEKRLT